MAAAFFVGGYDGFYGPGTGTFLILISQELPGWIRRASAQTKVNLSSNIAALVTFISRKCLSPGPHGRRVFHCGTLHRGRGMVAHDGQKGGPSGGASGTRVCKFSAK